MTRGRNGDTGAKDGNGKEVRREESCVNRSKEWMQSVKTSLRWKSQSGRYYWGELGRRDRIDEIKQIKEVS